MAKFKNKNTGAIIEESLVYYINKLRNNPDYIELEKDDKIASKKETIKLKTEIEE